MQFSKVFKSPRKTRHAISSLRLSIDIYIQMSLENLQLHDVIDVRYSRALRM